MKFHYSILDHEEYFLPKNTHKMEHGVVSLTYWGTNALLLDDGIHKLLIDPNFTRPSIPRMLGKLSSDKQIIRQQMQHIGLTQEDLVLLTHTHYDHALDAAEVLRQSGAKLAGSASAGMILRGTGLEDRFLAVETGQQIDCGDFQISFFLGKHTPYLDLGGEHVALPGAIEKPFHQPSLALRYHCGEVFSFYIQHPKCKLLCLGSGGLLPGAFDDLEVNVVALCIGGLGLKPRSYLEQYLENTVLKLKPNLVLLTHWDNFTRSLNVPSRFLPGTKRCHRILREILKDEPDIKVAFPRIGDQVHLG